MVGVVVISHRREAAEWCINRKDIGGGIVGYKYLESARCIQNVTDVTTKPCKIFRGGEK